MSNYIKLTDFASKDALPTGSANKIVKGTEIDDEFEAIETAVNTKANKVSPALTGTPTAPTATAGTSTTQVATTAFVTTAIAADAVTSAEFVDAIYPVGSVYINATSGTNPNTLLGHGTWVVFGAGRVPVGIDSSDTDFDTAEETGGSKEHTLTVDELPAHSHDSNGTADRVQMGTDNGVSYAGYTTGSKPYGPTTWSTASTGNGDAHNNLQPYIVVHMWKRTA